MRRELMTSLELIDCCRPLGAATLSDDEAGATAALFRTLADPARVKIVNLLATTAEPVREQVRQRYADAARAVEGGGGCGCGSGSCWEREGAGDFGQALYSLEQ